jgi:hypothetical protein
MVECMRKLLVRLSLATLMAGAPAAITGWSQSGKDDMKEAGHAVKEAAKKTQ